MNTTKSYRWFALALMVSLILILPATFLSANPENILPDGFPKPFEAEGQVFEISPTLKLESTQPIRLTADINTQTHLSFVISPIETTQGDKTTLTLSGSEGLGHMHQDGFFIESHPSGHIIWEQDVKADHHVYFLPEVSTINIWGRDDPRDEVVSKGVGIWLDATTCQLTKDVTEEIVIQADNLTLDGNGFSIISPVFYGIYLFGRTGVTVKNCVVNSGTIDVFFGSHNTIAGNTLYFNLNIYSSSNIDITDNDINAYYGIGVMLISNPSHINIDNNKLYGNLAGIAFLGGFGSSCHDISITNNKISFGNAGIAINYGSNITLTDNMVSFNEEWFGVYLANCDNNVISGNTITDNRYGLYLAGSTNSTVFHNNIWKNKYHNVASITTPWLAFPPLDPTTQPTQPIELSHPTLLEGNFWGRGIFPFFVAIHDSNDFDVFDSYPYRIEDGWKLGYTPADVTPPEITIISPQPQDYVNLGTITIDFSFTDDISGVKNYLVYLDDSQFSDGLLLDQGVEVPLINLRLGEHTLKIIAYDELSNRGEASVTFRSIPATQKLTDITTDIQALIDDPNISAKARKVLEDALAILIGQNQGQANNGVLDKLTQGNLVAAVTKIMLVINKLEQAQKLGVSTETIRQDLCNLTKQLAQAKLATAEALYGADHPVVIKMRNAYNEGVEFHNAGQYDQAALQFKLVQQWVVRLDNIGPVITFITPKHNGFLKSQTAEMVVNYTDELTTIYVPSIRVWVDGIDYTSMADITANELRLTGLTFANGTHTLTVSVNDTAEPSNNTTDSITFTIDANLPVLTIDRPSEGISIPSLSDLIFEASYSDDLAEINPLSLMVQLNDIDITTAFTKTTTSAAYYPTWANVELMDKYNLVRQALKEGQNELTVAISDHAGNRAEVIRGFDIFDLPVLDRRFFFRDQPFVFFSELEDDTLIINYPPGSPQTVILSGNVKEIFCESLHDPDVIWFETVEASYISTPLDIPGLGECRLRFNLDYAYPSYGSIDLLTGVVTWSSGYDVTIGDGITFPISFTLTGAITVTGTFTSITAFGSGTIPEDTPYLGGVSFQFAPGGKTNDAKDQTELDVGQTAVQEALNKLQKLLAKGVRGAYRKALSDYLTRISALAISLTPTGTTTILTYYAQVFDDIAKGEDVGAIGNDLEDFVGTLEEMTGITATKGITLSIGYFAGFLTDPEEDDNVSTEDAKKTRDKAKADIQAIEEKAKEEEGPPPPP